MWLPALAGGRAHSHDVAALDSADGHRREPVHCRVGRSFDGLAPVNQVGARSPDADLGWGGANSLSFGAGIKENIRRTLTTWVKTVVRDTERRSPKTLACKSQKERRQTSAIRAIKTKGMMPA